MIITLQCNYQTHNISNWYRLALQSHQRREQTEQLQRVHLNTIHLSAIFDTIKST